MRYVAVVQLLNALSQPQRQSQALDLAGYLVDPVVELGLVVSLNEVDDLSLAEVVERREALQAQLTPQRHLVLDLFENVGRNLALRDAHQECPTIEDSFFANPQGIVLVADVHQIFEIF